MTVDTMFLLMALPPTILLLILSILICYFGIDSLGDLRREYRILKYRLNVGRLLFTHRNKSYVRVWEESVARFRDLVLVSDGDRDLTFGQVDELSGLVGMYLYEKGVKEGNVVGVMMTNSVELVVAWLALVKLGAKPALLNTHLRGSSLLHCVRALKGVGVVLVNSGTERQIALEREMLRVLVYKVDFHSRETSPLVIGERVFGLMRMIPSTDQPGKWAGRRKAGDAVVGFMFTSGTTGYPKPVSLSFNRAWPLLKMGYIKRYGISAKDTIYCVLPLYHSTALYIGLHISMLSGARFVMREKFSVQTFWHEVKQQEATIVLYVGEMCRFLLNRKQFYLQKAEYKTRLALGNGLGKDIYSTFQETFKIPQIAEFYGQTEGFAFLASFLEKPGSLGYIPKLKLGMYPYRVVKCDTESLKPQRDPRTGLCVLCGVNEPGLLVADTRNIGRRSVYRAGSGEVRLVKGVDTTKDEYVSTGDLVTIGPDRSYYFQDRLGDTFRWKGENVSTTEVSACILYLPNVAEVCVYGVQIPGHDGRAGMAALVPHGDLDMEQLYAQVAENLPNYAVPLFLRVVQSLDTTPTFKYKTGQLKEEGFELCGAGTVFFCSHSSGSYLRTSVEIVETVNDGDISVFK